MSRHDGLPPGFMFDRSDKARLDAEVAAGLRCSGCGRRITTGFEFTAANSIMRIGDLGGPRQADITVVHTCAGQNGCNAMLRAMKGAAAVRVIDDEMLFLDDPKVQALVKKIAEKTGLDIAKAESEIQADEEAGPDGGPHVDATSGGILLDPKGGKR